MNAYNRLHINTDQSHSKHTLQTGRIRDHWKQGSQRSGCNTTGQHCMIIQSVGDIRNE